MWIVVYSWIVLIQVNAYFPTSIRSPVTSRRSSEIRTTCINHHLLMFRNQITYVSDQIAGIKRVGTVLKVQANKYIEINHETEIRSTLSSKTNKKNKSAVAKKRKSRSVKKTSYKSSTKVMDTLKNKTKEKRKKKTETKKKKKKRKNAEEKLYFWSNASDYFMIQPVVSYPNNSSSTATSYASSIEQQNEALSRKYIQFTIRGNPLPLQRHRTSRGFVYNPSANKQKQFYESVISMLPSSCFSNTTNKNKSLDVSYNDDCSDTDHDHSSLSSPQKLQQQRSFAINNINSIKPFFMEDELLSIKIIFHQKRPKNHFISSKPGPGRIRPKILQSIPNTRVDVDNLAKFVLDSLNQVLYVDDRQVVDLHVIKVYDNEHDCLGKTELYICR